MAGEIQLITPEDIERERQASKSRLGQLSGTQHTSIKEGAPSPRYENINYDYFDNPEEVGAAFQGTGEKLINGIAKAGVTMAGSIAENTAGIFAGAGQMAANAAAGGTLAEVASGLYDNPLGRLIDDINNDLRDRLPHYYSEAEKEKGGIEQAFSAGSAANFWTDKFLNGAGYWGGALATGFLLPKIPGYKQLLKTRGLDEMKVAMGLAEGGELTAAAGLNTIQDLAQYTISNKLVDAGKQIAVGGLMSFGESSVEARQIKNDATEKLLDLGYTEKEANQLASSLGNVGFGINLIVTGTTNMMQFGKTVAGGYGARRLGADKIVFSETGEAMLSPVLKGSKTLDRVGRFLMGNIEEGGQEFIQHHTQQGLGDYYLQRYDKQAGFGIGEAFGSIYESIQKDAFSKESIEATFLGALLGGPGQVVMGRGERAKEQKDAATTVDLINNDSRLKEFVKLTQSDPNFQQFVNYVENTVRTISYDRQAEAALRKGDKFEFYNQTYNQFKSFLQTVEEAGGTDFLIQRFDALKNIPADEFKKSFGIDDKIIFTEQDKIQKIESQKATALKIAEVHRNLSAKYAGLSKPVFDAVFDAATNFENIDGREASLAMEIQKEVPAFDYQELRKELQAGNKENYRKLLDEWISVIKNTNPMKYDEIKEKLADLEKLADRREFYINQFNEALKNPDKIEAEVKEANAPAEESNVSADIFKPVEVETSEFEEVNRVNEKYKEYTQPVPQLTAEANVSAITNKLTNLRKLKQETQKLIGLTEQELVKEELAKSLKAINDAISFFEKNKVAQEEKVKTNIEAARPLIKGTKRLQDILQYTPKLGWLPGITREGLLKITNLPWSKLRNKVSFEVLDYNPEEQYSPLTDEDGVFPDNFKIKNGITITMPDGTTATKSILLKVDGIPYGYLLDPDRFVVLVDGKYVPLAIDENLPKHLKLFRPEFVNNGKVTNEGLKFVHNYKSQKAAFDYIKKQIAAGQPINRAEVLNLVDLEFNAVLEDIETPVPIVEHLKASGDKYKTEHIIGGKKIVLGPLVYNGKNKQLDEPYFYEFDGEKFVPLSNQNGVDSEDITNYLIKQFEENRALQGKVETLGNSLVALLLRENGQDFVVGMKFGEEFPNAGNDFLQSVVSMVNEVTNKVKSGVTGNIFQTLQKKVVFETDYGIKNKTEEGKRKYVSLKLVTDKWSDKEGKTPYRLKLRVTLPHLGKDFSIQLQSMDEKHPGFIVKDDKLFIKQGKEIEEVTTTEQFLEAVNVIIYNQTEAYYSEIQGLQIQRISTPPESNPTTLGGAYMVKDLLTTIRFTAKEKFQAPAADKEVAVEPELFGIKLKEEKKEPVKETPKETPKETVTEELSAEDINVLTKNMNGFETLNSAEQIYFSKNIKRLASYVKDESKLFKEYLANKKEKPVEKSVEVKKEEVVDKKAALEQPKTKDLGNAADFDENAPFKLSTEEGTRRELFEDEEELSSILNVKTEENPNGVVSLKEMEDINENIATKNYTWGRLVGNVIELAKKRGKGTGYHEAFHAIFRIFLNKDQRQAAYKAALNKYGKPSNNVLVEFKNQHPSRINLTVPDLTLLWLEEQMADDYMGSELAWRSMGILEKVFNKLKRLAKAILNNYSELELLFQDINKGRYKKANPSEDVIYGTAYKLIKGIDNSVLNEGIISRIVSGVIAKKLVNGKFTIEDVRALALNLRNGYYSNENFDELIKQAKKNVDKKKLVADNIKDMLSSVREALSEEENITLLYTIAKERITNREIEIDDIDLEAEKDTPLDFAAKEASERGGIAAGSKRMKEYLSTVKVGVDEFQIGLTESQLDEPQHQVYANPYMLHNSLDRSLTDTKKQDLLRKLYLISKDNRLLRAFYKRLANDINRDLNLNLPKSEIEEKIAEMSSAELSRSVHYNLLVANYNKIRGNRNKTLVDLKTGDNLDIASYRSMRSNLTDIQEVVTNQWRSKWNSLRLDEREKFVKESLTKIQDIFLSYNKFINVAKREDSIDELQNLFAGLGIDLSRAYIKYSWANSWWTKSEQPNKLQSNFIQELSKSPSHVVDEISKIFEELSAFTGVGFITWEDTQNFLYTTKGGSLHKKLTEEVSDTGTEQETITEGATSRLKRIALGNSVFDETVQPVTIKNFAGKTIYLNLFPNYMFYETLLWRLGDRIKAFKENEELFKQMYTQDQQLEDWMYDVYKQALNHNHLLTHENAVDFFQQFFVNINEGIVKTKFNAAGEQTFLGDDKEVEYQKTADAEFYALQLAYFADDVRNNLTTKIKGQRYTPFITMQNSGKNTQIAVTLPVLEVTKGTKLNQKGIDAVVNYIKQEHERIHKEFSGPNILGWNDTAEGRKSDFWNFVALEEIAPDLYSRLLKDKNFPVTEVAEVVPLLLEKRYAEYKEALVEEELITEDGKNVRLPEFYVENGKISDGILFDFFVNNYLNSLAFNNMMFGDMSFRFKNFLDFVKRAPGAFAAGPSMVDGFSTIKVVPDVKAKNEYIPGTTNTTDGQGWNTVEWFADVYLTGLAKSDPSIQAVFKKIRRGYSLNTEEYNILKNNHALVGSKKISMFDMMFYFKGSLDTLMRSVVSAEPSKEDRAALDGLYDRLDRGENVIEEINNLWKPAPGRKLLHEQLNRMYSEGIQLQVSQSTIKTQVALNTPLKISNEYIREQLVTDGFKDYIPGGVQKIQLMASEQADVETTFGGRKTTFKQMGEMYDNLLALKQKFSYNYLTKLLFKGEGIPNYEYLVTLFNNTLDELGEDTMFKKQFTPSEDGGGFKFNFNNLNVLRKSEQIFNSIVNKMTFEQNVPGHKLTLKSSNGYNVIRDEKGVAIPSYITRKNYKKYKDYEETPLRILTDENGVTYAECIITEQTAKRYGYTRGMNIEFIGSRIPTDDKHSLVYLKVVDVLPKETGNQIILPFELIDASGHDFDIDSEFLESGSFFWKNDRITYFGEYLKVKKAKNALKAAFDEYIEGASEYDLRVEIAYKKAIEANEELNALITKADNMLINKKIITEETGQEPIDVLYSDDFAVDKLLLGISETAGIDSYGDITYNKEEFKNTLLEIKELKEAIKTATLNSLGYATSLEEFTKQYSKQIEANRIAYSKGEYNSISPLTLGEVNQLLFDIGKQLIHNPGNAEIAKEATSRKVVIDIREKYKDILSNLGVVKDVNSAQSLAKVKNFTSTGSANIGIAAQNLILFQYLAKSDARNRNTPGTRIFEFGKGPIRRNSMMGLHVTIEVDAGTHNDPAYFNLTEDTLAPYILRNMKGQSFEEVFLWNIQPAMLELSKKLAKSHTIFAGVDYAGTIIKAERIKYTNKTNEYTGQFKDKNPSIEQLASVLRNEASISPEDRDYIQLLAITKFEEAWQENQYLRNLTSIIGLAKGMKPTFAEMSVIDDSLEKLGIVEHNGKLVHSVAFLNDLENYPYDGLEIIRKSPFLNQLLSDYLQYKKDSGYFFISQSPFGKTAINKVKELVKFYKRGDETVFNNINRLVVSFLENKRLRQLGKTVKPEEFLGVEDTPITVDLFKILKKSKEFKDNKFLNALDVESYSFKKEGILKGRKLHHFVINSRIKKDPYYQEQMMNDFDALLKTRKYKNVTTSELLTNGEPTSLNNIAKIFAQKLIEIAIFKDSLAYKNRSYAQHIDPELLVTFNRALNDILTSANLKNSFKEIYGQDFDQLSEEFIEYAGRDYSLKDDYTYSSKADLYTARKQSWVNSAMLIAMEKDSNLTKEKARNMAIAFYDKEKNNISSEDFAIDVQDEKIVVNLYVNSSKTSKDTSKRIVASNVAEIKNNTKLFKTVARLDDPTKVGLMPLPFVYIRTDKGMKVFRLASYKESGLKALNKDEFIVNKAEYLLDSILGHKDIMSTALPLTVWQDMQKNPVVEKEQTNKYQKQIDQLYSDIIGFPKDMQKEALEIIENSKVTTDEEMGELINKICNLGK